MADPTRRYRLLALGWIVLLTIVAALLGRIAPALFGG